MRNLLVLLVLVLFVGNTKVETTTSSTIIATSSDKKLTELLELLGVSKYINSIKKLKSYKTIEQIGELDYELKQYYARYQLWKKFPINQFESDLKSLLRKGFTQVELEELVDFYRKPFVAKMFRHSILNRDVFAFSQNMLNSKYSVEKFSKERLALVKVIYLVHGMKLQVEASKKYLSGYSDKKTTQLLYVDKTNLEKIETNPVELLKRQNNLENFTISSLSSELTNFRQYEIIEYTRLIRKHQTIQKFVQLFATYQYKYLLSFINHYKTPKVK